jgi:hypothetical protein
MRGRGLSWRLSWALAGLASILLVDGVPAQDAGTPQVPAARTGTDDARAGALQRRLEERWRLVPIQDGLLLVPRHAGRTVRGVELRQGTVAVDGEPVTGTELRARLGADADAILEASYLGTAALTGLAGMAREVSADAVAAPAEPPATRPAADPTPAYARQRNARVRIGSDLIVEEDERVRDAAVAILGSVVVHGRVDGDVVAVGGDVRLTPRAVVRGDVTAVGGSIVSEPGARLDGGASEVAIRFPPVHRPRLGIEGASWWPDERWWAGLSLVWTAGRMVVAGVLAVALALLAGGFVTRLRGHIVNTPWRVGVVGFAAHLLLGPAVVAIVLVLVVSVIGIPLVALLPILALAGGVFWAAGFAAVAQVVGAWIPGLRGRPLGSLVAGLALVWALSLGARALWYAGGGWLAPAVLGTIGIAVEWTAWTVALGALIVSWLESTGARRRPAPSPAAPPHLEGWPV